MIWQVWALLVLIGAGSAYIAFVEKRAAIFTSLVTILAFGAATFGAFGIEVPHGGSTSPFVATETAAAVVCATIALMATIVLAAAVTGQYGSPDAEDAPGAGAVTRRIGR
jgi:hypothetical protein